MIRADGAADARHAMMVLTGSNGTAFQRRVQTGGVSHHTGGPMGGAPTWVRLRREGDRFTAFQSNDGVAWTLVGSATIPMGTTVRIGLAVTGHTDAASCSAAFDQVSVIATTAANG